MPGREARKFRSAGVNGEGGSVVVVELAVDGVGRREVPPPEARSLDEQPAINKPSVTHPARAATLADLSKPVLTE